MAKEEHVEMEGEITHCGKGGSFRVLCGGEHSIVAKLSGKMRKHRIRVVLGDTVTVAVSSYDPTRGFITFRRK